MTIRSNAMFTIFTAALACSAQAAAAHDLLVSSGGRTRSAGLPGI